MLFLHFLHGFKPVLFLFFAFSLFLCLSRLLSPSQLPLLRTAHNTLVQMSAFPHPTTHPLGPVGHNTTYHNGTATYGPTVYPAGLLNPPGIPYTRALVLPYTIDDDISWTTDLPSGTTPYLYSADNTTASLTAPANKGHEAMVYLTYIIRNYHSLPDVVVFTHAHQKAWHNPELLGFDAVEMLSRLRSEWVVQNGYVNLRCDWDPGCPGWLRPGNRTWDITRQEQAIIGDVWLQLFPFDTVLPEVLRQPCCAQFAVSGQRVRAVPWERWVRWREWVMETELEDYFSGRVWEFVWQFVFTGREVVCPQERACWCGAYGLCFEEEGEWEGLQKLVKNRAGLRKAKERLDEEKGDGEESNKAIEELKRDIEALDGQIEELRLAAFSKGDEMFPSR
jgi:hypothetical protein